MLVHRMSQHDLSELITPLSLSDHKECLERWKDHDNIHGEGDVRYLADLRKFKKYCGSLGVPWAAAPSEDENVSLPAHDNDVTKLQASQAVGLKATACGVKDDLNMVYVNLVRKVTADKPEKAVYRKGWGLNGGQKEKQLDVITVPQADVSRFEAEGWEV